jgi:hypothetical protein
MPIAGSGRADSPLRIEGDWDLVGQWKVIPVNSNLEGMCVWNDTHALMQEKVSDALKHPGQCLLLAEPDAGKAEALLVKVMEREMPRTLWRQYVVALYFHPKMLKEYIDREKREREPTEAEVGLLGDINNGTVDPDRNAWELVK